MGIKITPIDIGNLSQESVKSLVAEALKMEDEEDEVETLAALIHKKTEGNVFFVLTFLRSLYDEELITYNFVAMRWLWDDDAVKAKFVTENVATILVDKLRRLSKSSQILLKVASCLGSTFSVSAAAAVARSLSSSDGTLSQDGDDTSLDMSVVSSIMDGFEKEGLWEKDGGEASCRFTHDQVQSAAFELVPFEERDEFQGRVGSILMESIDSESLEELLFEVVSLRNCAKASVSPEKRHELAMMNLRAGLKASRNAAFDAAADFFQTGHELMGEAGWEADSDSMLRLCSEGANASFIIGDLETMNMFLEEVIDRQHLSVKDKLKVFEIKILAANATGNFNEAINTGIEVRRQLGLRTPPNKPTSLLTVIKEFTKTTRTVGPRSAEDIASLPELTDNRIIMGQKALELLLVSSYQVQPTLYPLIVFHLVRTSIKHGINSSSCDAFATFGLLLCGLFGKPEQGREMGKAVELLLAKPGMKGKQSKARYHCEAFINHWTAPIQGTLAPYLAGYQSGLELGDVESACFCLTFRAVHLV